MNKRNLNPVKLRTTLIGCLHRLVRKFLCMMGWHEWTWKYESGTPLDLNSPPPDHAKCSRCKSVYNNQLTRTNDS